VIRGVVVVTVAAIPVTSAIACCYQEAEWRIAHSMLRFRMLRLRDAVHATTIFDPKSGA